MFARRSLVLLLVLLAALLAVELSLGLCVQEDAFISFRYARNLVAGHGLVYNPGDRVEGYTNFLWTVAIAAAMRLGADPVPTSRLLGMACSLLLVTVAWRAARARDAARGTTGGLVAAALLAASLPVAVEAVQGLETVAFALLATAGVLAGVRAREPGGPAATPRVRRLAGGALLLLLAALTRPEGVGLFGLAALAALIWRRRGGGRLLPRGEAAAAALFVALYFIYWFWRFRYYGQPLPNTFYAKTGGGWGHVASGLGYVGRFLLLHPAVTLLTVWAAVAGLLPRRARDGAAAGTGVSLLTVTAAVVVAGYLLYVISVGGDFKDTFRFVIPVLPLWALALDDAVSRRGWPATAGRGARSRAVVAAAVLAVILANAAAMLPSTARWTRLRAWDLRRRTACGLWLAAHARPGDVLAIHSAGIVPYYSRLRTIDMWGINDAHIAHRKMPGMGRSDRRIGHEKGDAPYVFAQNPTYHLDELFYVTPQPVPDLRRRIFASPAAASVAARYQERSVPLEIDDGRGPRQWWFNFLELRR